MLQWTHFNKVGLHFSMKEKTENGNEDFFWCTSHCLWQGFQLGVLLLSTSASGVAPPLPPTPPTGLELLILGSKRSDWSTLNLMDRGLVQSSFKFCPLFSSAFYGLFTDGYMR